VSLHDRPVAPVRLRFPRARVLRHTSSQPAGRFVDWMVQRQTCAVSREVSARKGPTCRRPIAMVSASTAITYPHPQRPRRSSLKERGRVKALVTSDLGCLRPRRTRRSRRRGQGSGGARPRSGRRALRSAPGSTNNVGGGDSSGAGPQKSECVGGALVKAGGPGWGQAQVGCRSSLRRGRGRHDGVRGVYWPAGSIRGGDHARCWGS
jgi:hypothetical protein